MATLSFVVPEGTDSKAGFKLQDLPIAEVYAILGYLTTDDKAHTYVDESNPYGDAVFSAHARARVMDDELITPERRTEVLNLMDSYPADGTHEKRMQFVVDNGDLVYAIARRYSLAHYSPLAEYMHSWRASPEAARAARKYVALYRPCVKCGHVENTENVVDEEDDAVDYMAKFATNKIPLVYCPACDPSCRP
jgi:hypothetical protein